MHLRSRASYVLVLVVLTAAVSCAGGSGAGECSGGTVQLRRSKVLTVGVDFAYPPFAFDHPDTGVPTGFEVELVDKVASQLGLKLLLVNRTSAALIPGLLAHRHDLAASGLRDTAELSREVCVSEPYLDAPLGILGRAGDPRDLGPNDLSGRTVGVVEDSRADAWARANLPSPIVRRVPTHEDLLSDLRAGTLDATVDDLPIQRYAEVRLKEFEVRGVIRTGEHYVVAASTDNGALMKLVNDALRKLKDDGTIDKLRGRWFGR